MSDLLDRHYRTVTTDLLILGSGGAGLFAALHAARANPSLDVTVMAKGLLGKSGCTRMVQGGYNVALSSEDSLERHFMDTIVGGKWLPNQDLAWRLVEGAVERVHQLENELGCFFDRNPDGSLHQKAFAGQSFDRTVHKGDLTGIEIINRLMEQVWSQPINRLEEHRAVRLIMTPDGDAIAGVLAIDIASGKFVLVRARAVLLATGGGPTMYRYHTPSGDKSCDGMAMALRAGLRLRDMEMVQFHPTGLLAGVDTRMTGTVLEEGLRGAGGYLLNSEGARFMTHYHPHAERATRDIVSRSIYAEMVAGRTSPNGGVYIEMKHLGRERVSEQFSGMVQRCADCGFDLAGDRVEVVPTAHYMMGGIEFDLDTHTAIQGLYVAGEDAGGVHGANRLGGNGVANSTVYGGIAGDAIAAEVQTGGALPDVETAAVESGIEACLQPFLTAVADINEVRVSLQDVMWDQVGIVRNTDSLEQASSTLDGLTDRLKSSGIPDQHRAFNLTWHDWLNIDSQLLVSKAITMAARQREDSRGAHYRDDFPDTRNLEKSEYTRVSLSDSERLTVDSKAVEFTRVKPGESLIDEEAGAPPV